MLAWQSSLKIGIKTIDQQHKELFDRLSQLVKAVEKSRNYTQKAIEIIGFLDQYVEYHFREEEALMARHGYPRLREHAALHQTFRNDLAFLKSEVKGDRYTPGLAVNLIHHLTEWLVDHILDIDQRMGPYVRGPEEAPPAPPAKAKAAKKGAATAKKGKKGR